MNAFVEIDILLPCRIGFYRDNDIIPNEHRLHLRLSLDVELVLVGSDGMGYVFDYDPIRDEAMRLAAEQHYETQEFLLSRIVLFCARFREVSTIYARLSKAPVTSAGGSIAVGLELSREDLEQIRARGEISSMKST